MNLSHVVIITFFLCFIFGTGVTLLCSYIWDMREGLVKQGTSAYPPFPQIMPLVAAPSLAGDIKNHCVSFVGNAVGKYVPSPLEKIKSCGSVGDCLNCSTSPVEIPLTCVSASQEVAEQQKALNNESEHYCLPEPVACLVNQPKPCTHDLECAGCSDALNPGESFGCEVVESAKSMIYNNQLLNIPQGMFCLPNTPQCSSNGYLQWTTAGWKCTCYYPTIHGGESCEKLLACNNHLTTEFSSKYQKLLVNENKPVAEPWDISSKVNPVLCHPKNELDRSKWNEVCGPANVANTVCQCDGLMSGSYQSFHSDPLNKLSCVVDSCFFNALGGRRRDDFAAQAWTSNSSIPPNQCICSGANSRLWDSVASNSSEGFIYKGRCSDTVIAGSEVTLRADPVHASSVSCSNVSNQHAEISSLVPGIASDATKNATVNVCSPDPCRALYADPSFTPVESLKSWGHYDAVQGTCGCVSPAMNVGSSAELGVNPVGSVCVNACLGMTSTNETDWPCRKHPYRPCTYMTEESCTTDANGKAKCSCPVGCGNTDGSTCALQFESGGCFGYVGVPNICQPGVDGATVNCLCHQGTQAGATALSSGCKKQNEVYAMCTGTNDETPLCRTSGGSLFVSCAGSACPSERGCDRFDV